jgi:23S rRNA (guanine745-N1)-methyltransferase
VSLDRVQGLLSCPNCRSELSLDAGRLRCPLGHSFDVAREGYVNLSGTGEPANADTAAMLAARRRVQSAGVFAPVADVVAHLARGRSPVLEGGAGTGYYLAAALGTDPAAAGLAIDVAKAAVRQCARADARIGAVVADVWQRLPVTDRSVGVVLSVFAPRNLGEFARVLHLDGRLISVTPRPDHLAELRSAHELLDVPSGKAEQLVAATAEFFDLVDTRVVKYRFDASAEVAADLIAMGPNAFHHVPEQVNATTVGIDVTVQSFRPLEG